MSIINKIFGEKCSECNKNRTKNHYKERLICKDCKVKIKSKEENLIKCPKCNIPMKKEIIEDKIILDKCETCKGYWLDKEELDKIEGIYKDKGSSGMGIGIAMGYAIGHR